MNKRGLDEEQKRLAEELLFSSDKPLSFGKQLFYGVFAHHKVFPYPCVSKEEQNKTEALLHQLTQFANEYIDAVAIDRNAEIPSKVIQGLGDLGILGMTIPQEYGGLGMSQYAYCKMVEFLASRCSSTALFVNAHQSVGLKALLLFGTNEQKQRWLSPLAKGEQIAAFSLTEPNAGSDANGIETRAEYDSEKKAYIINGRKQWTTNGSMADVLTVMAKTEIQTPQGKQDKVTAFLVTPDMPGFEVTAASLEKVGMRGSKTANLAFHNMAVPEANILGPLGGGLKVCLTVLDYGRTTFGATCTGAAKYLTSRAIEHARNRYQFKRPIGSFALVKQKIATISALTYAMDAATYLTAGFVDSGVEDFMLESAMLKVFASDSLWTIIYETMQIFGGRSFFCDEPFERIMRDARLNMIGEGANEVMRAFIGLVGVRDVGVELQEIKNCFTQPWRDPSHLLRFCKQTFRRWNASRVPVQSKLIQKEAEQLSKAIRRFGIETVRALVRYREDIIEKQLILNRLATAAMALYTTSAVLSKIDLELSTGNHKNLSVAIHYCHLAMSTLNDALRGLSHNNDGEIETVSDEITKLSSW